MLAALGVGFGIAAVATIVGVYAADTGSSADGSSPEDILDTVGITTYGCDDLADEAVQMSAEDEGLGVDLLKVRNPQIAQDHRDDYTLPSGDGESLILSCKGGGVWSDGDSSTRVMLRWTVDSDGDEWVAYKPIW